MVSIQQKQRESALLVAAALDFGTAVMLLTVGTAYGSLTSTAEGLRAGLMVLIDIVCLDILRRIHRGAFTGYEFGTSKLEHLCGSFVAVGLLGGALWIGTSAVYETAAGRSVATPFGLALAAVCGSVNLCVNFIAWDSVRRAAAASSIVMRAQLRSRWTKLLSSLVVQVTMTVAAVTKDLVVAGVADAVGALIVCIVMLTAAWRLLAEAFSQLLDKSVRPVAEPALREATRALPPGLRLVGFRSRGTRSAFSLEVKLELARGVDLAVVPGAEQALAAELMRLLPAAEVSLTVLATQERQL